MTETISFTTSRGHELAMTLYGSDLAADSPCVVYLHGFKGFKDWGFVPFLGETMVANGFRLLAMNFSHNGIGPNPLEFTEEKKFRDNTFSLELEEAVEVVKAYVGGKLWKIEGTPKMGLLGHSRGGGIALLAGSQLPELSGVATWAAVSTFRRYPEPVIEKWRKEGQLEVRNARTGQILHMGWQIHEDLLEHIDGKLSIEQSARNIGKPLLVVHGAQDPVVLPVDADNIASWAGEWVEGPYFVLGAAHTFGAKHPFEGPNAVLDDTLNRTVSFFQRHLNS